MNQLLSYYEPTSYTQKLKMMEKGEQFTYISTLPPPPSRAAPVGCGRGIGVGYNLI
jgi:hypothetical protein